MSDYAVRVAAGAALLDRVRPGWAREIEPDRLRMEALDLCILGQLWGDYTAGCEALGFPHASAWGFDLRRNEAFRERIRAVATEPARWYSPCSVAGWRVFANLGRAWMQEIATRRQAG